MRGGGVRAVGGNVARSASPDWGSHPFKSDPGYAGQVALLAVLVLADELEDKFSLEPSSRIPLLRISAT